MIEHSEMSVLFCENAEQLTKIGGVRSQCPSLTQLIAFEGATDGVLSLDALKARGTEITDEVLSERAGSVTPEQVATIVYTSGTTGPPKGVMLTHHNITSDVAMNLERLPHDGHERHFVFLPLAHVLTRVVQFLALTSTSQLIYWKRNPATLLDEIAEAKPTHLPSVPRSSRRSTPPRMPRRPQQVARRRRSSAARSRPADAWRRRSARVDRLPACWPFSTDWPTSSC